MCTVVQVEVQAEALQQHDDWDATPLYYAAYAGNKDLVKYLLSRGAKCEEKVRIASVTPESHHWNQTKQFPLLTHCHMEPRKCASCAAYLNVKCVQVI